MNPGTHFKQGGQYNNREWLYNQYVELGLSLRTIANKCNRDHQNIRYWLKKFSITTHPVGDLPMEKSSQWKGGQSPYSKEFNRTLRFQVRVRDNFTCHFCGIEEKNYGRKLDVHHINYNKLNCSLANLISLCHRCHLKTNHGDRLKWEQICVEKLSMNG